MYVRLVQFKLGSGKRSAAEAVADKVIPAIRKQPGCDRSEFYSMTPQENMGSSSCGRRGKLRMLPHQ